MSDVRGFPAALGQFVAGIQNMLGFPSEGNVTLPRATLIAPGAAVPEVYQRSYEALLSDAPDLQPYTVHFPPHRQIKDVVNGRLVCCLGTNIHVLEDDGGQVKPVCYPVGDISFIETGKVLLYSWVRLHGRNTDGAFTWADLRFNTVTDYVIAPIVEWARSPVAAPDTVDTSAERDKFDYLCETNLKLRNYSWRSIMDGERVVQDIYQPEIRVEAFSLFGFSLFNKRSDAHMTILTNRELILIQDGASRRFGRNVVYGGVWHYLPLDRIVSAAISETEDGLLTLSITLPGDERLEQLFAASFRPELEKLTRLRGLI